MSVRVSRAARSSAVTSALLVALASCRAPATVVVFVVGSDAPAARSAVVDARVWRAEMDAPRAGTTIGRATLTRDGEELFSIVPNGEPRSQRVDVLLQATLAATPTEPTQVIRRALRFSFIPQTRLVQRVFFSMACLNRSTDCRQNPSTCTVQDACEERGLTCGDNGECAPIDVTPEPSGDASVRFDASASRDAAMDAARDARAPMDAAMDVRSDAPASCGDASIGAMCTVATPCRTGVLQCASGVARCEVAAMAAAGTSCGAGRVCDLAGDCVPCATGMACTPTEPCRRGSITCSAGAASCVAGALLPAGTPCGADRRCTAAGACQPCVEGASCTSSNPCATASISCATGAPVCVDRASAADGTSCGASRVCRAGACVCAGSGGCAAGQVCVRDACSAGSLVPMYTCPSLGGGTLGGGTWGYYGCAGQTWSVPSCTTIESPRNRSDACVSAGRMQVTSSPVAPSGASAVALYRCPSVGGGALGGGDWGFYECQGQLSSNATCMTIESPRNSSTGCPAAGYVTVFSAAPTPPPGGRVVQVYRCPTLGPGSLGGGTWGYYGCLGQLATTPSCTTIEWSTTRSSPCASAGFIVLE